MKKVTHDRVMAAALLLLALAGCSHSHVDGAARSFSSNIYESASYSEVPGIEIDCGDVRHKMVEVLAVVSDELPNFVGDKEVVPTMSTQQLELLVANIEKLSFVGRGKINSKEYLKLTYYGPNGEHMLGVPTGLDLVVESCTWTILDIGYWED